MTSPAPSCAALTRPAVDDRLRRRWPGGACGYAPFPRTRWPGMRPAASSSSAPAIPEWPSKLDDLYAAQPYARWVRGTGDLRSCCAQRVAIIGARAATAYGPHYRRTCLRSRCRLPQGPPRPPRRYRGAGRRDQRMAAWNRLRPARGSCFEIGSSLRWPAALSWSRPACVAARSALPGAPKNWAGR